MKNLIANAVVAGGMLAASVSTAVAVPVHYEIVFTASRGVGGTGSFTVDFSELAAIPATGPYAGGVIQNFSATIGGETINLISVGLDYGFWSASDGQVSGIDNILSVINDAFYTGLYFQGVQPRLSFGKDCLGVGGDLSTCVLSPPSFRWRAGYGDRGIPDAFTLDPIGSGNYVISPSPVPLPAALPLLGGALSLLGFFGWRRKRMAAA